MKIQEYMTSIDLSFPGIWTYLLGKVRNNWFLILSLLSNISNHYMKLLRIAFWKFVFSWVIKKYFYVFGPFPFSWDMPFDYKNFLMEESWDSKHENWENDFVCNFFLSSDCILWEINLPFPTVKMFWLHDKCRRKFVNVEQ